ncbi:MBL fold metallo-hydrolase [Coriobacteriia bacterium Es71-Z0120]|uniref:MBL fold metallo-hydrolase n=1 Tax=Parvivirga hydrogeniphila TaxID=2939460 RepID=UPI002260A41D|nr:MBL fold metallo-hydrolase [Parvivirga hydrogeniphila]MCL4079441.1 MBL fold metallo-hydrolase [Parvivirga hydrogeniphila]
MSEPRPIDTGRCASPEAEGVALLASGSRGNAALVYAGATGILIDCGISARQARLRIAAAGLSHVRIEAVVLTHEHADHVAGMRVLARELRVPVLATHGTLDAIAGVLAEIPDVGPLRAGEVVAFGGLSVLPFRSSHDAAEPVGYRVTFPSGRTLGYLSDTGFLTGEAEEALRGCDVLAIESNHDVGMLERGPYPAFLKQRIRSRVGHLSNDDAAAALAALAHDGLHTVVGLHLSEQNNTPRAAHSALAIARDRLGLACEILAASQHTPVVCAVDTR